MNSLFVIFWFAVLTLAEDKDFEKSLVHQIQKAGHRVEVHKVHTEDHYILTVFRLPSKLRKPKIVFIMHGLESSAADYVIGDNGASSLAYLLSDNGYDVWLGNARGNIFSQAHKMLNTESGEFWKFSFHEIAVYDLPAMIDYALDKANATSLTYCGYSQGATTFFILLSMRPEYNVKISTAHLMAPVAYIRFPTRFLKLAAPAVTSQFIKDFVLGNHLYEIIPLRTQFRTRLAQFCDKKMASSEICKSIYMLVGGNTSGQYNEDLLPKVFKFFPASAGYGQYVHYGNIINENGEFIRLDHIKKRKNLELYGQSVPPRYNLSNVQTKLHFLYGTNDVVANPKDVQFLMAKLKPVTIGITKLNDWNHFDFVLGKDIQKKCNNVILQKIKSREFYVKTIKNKNKSSN